MGSGIPSVLCATLAVLLAVFGVVQFATADTADCQRCVTGKYKNGAWVAPFIDENVCEATHCDDESDCVEFFTQNPPMWGCRCGDPLGTEAACHIMIGGGVVVCHRDPERCPVPCAITQPPEEGEGYIQVKCWCP